MLNNNQKCNNHSPNIFTVLIVLNRSLLTSGPQPAPSPLSPSQPFKPFQVTNDMIVMMVMTVLWMMTVMILMIMLRLIGKTTKILKSENPNKMSFCSRSQHRDARQGEVRRLHCHVGTMAQVSRKIMQQMFTHKVPILLHFLKYLCYA